jgi:hypothetical protein
MMHLLKNKWERFLLISVSILVIGFEVARMQENEYKAIPHFESENKILENALPAGYHLLNNNREPTTYVGTADNPTIDGGVINNAGSLVSHDEPFINNVLPVDKSKTLILPQNLQIKFQDPQLPVPSFGNAQKEKFSDNWATSNDVKRLLLEAAQAGKLNYVLQKSQELHLPASVAVVPMVESRYQTEAVSNKGAAGAWQLMPSLAKDYGISNADRFQFVTATDTALQYLKNLHQQFGNWELAFAAYNAGAARVENALIKNPEANSINDLDLPIETKNYVFRMKAITQKLQDFNNDQ